MPCGTVQRTIQPAKSRDTHAGVVHGGAGGGRGFGDSLQSFVLKISSNANSHHSAFVFRFQVAAFGNFTSVAEK